MVRTGETLIAIASSIRPQGMTLDQTIQALVNANPNVFIDNNANRMLAGKVLNIPSRSELQRLAASSPVKADTAPEKGNEAANATEVKTEKPVTQPETQVKDAGANPPQQEEVKQASAAQTEQAASASINENAASAAPASDVQDAMASDAQDNVLASEPVATTDSAAESVESESDGNLWKWLLAGGAALIAAWLLLRVAGKRKDEPKAASASRKDEEKPVQKSVAASAAAAVAASKVTPSEKTQEGLLVEDDFEDDIVINEVEESSNVDDVKLDLGKIDHSQAGILSSAVTHDAETEQRRHADWDNIESTESVYEPEPENPYQPVSVVMPERNEEPLEFTVETPENSDDHVLPFDVKQDQDVQIQETKEEAEKEEAASEFVIEEGALEWEAEDVSVAADKSNSERGFVSESVGMTAPLEAKYDLAKMYIEIGDPEAARETLQGLIEEAEGDILYKAQKLMKELGA